MSDGVDVDVNYSLAMRFLEDTAANHGAEPPSDSRNLKSSHHLSILRIAPSLLVNREFFFQSD
jgi:hypothetical protein